GVVGVHTGAVDVVSSTSVCGEAVSSGVVAEAEPSSRPVVTRVRPPWSGPEEPEHAGASNAIPTRTTDTTHDRGWLRDDTKSGSVRATGYGVVSADGGVSVTVVVGIRPCPGKFGPHDLAPVLRPRAPRRRQRVHDHQSPPVRAY